MSKAERLFNLVNFLRGRRTAMTAEALADSMSVSVRTIYRDIQALTVSGVPIEGEPGVGYLLNDKSHLPPLMFSAEEVLALMSGIDMVKAFTDPELSQAAATAEQKIRTVLSPDLKYRAEHSPYYIPTLKKDKALRQHHWLLRLAALSKNKVTIEYTDGEGQNTERVVWPLGIMGTFGNWMLLTYCELRSDYRTFRLDRLQSCVRLDAKFETHEELSFQHYIQQHIELHSITS